MNRLTITKELIKIANLLDNSKLHGEANSLTKIAEDMMDDKFDPMVYNPDDEASDDLDAKSDDFDTLIDTLMKAHTEGELNDEDISSIMNILDLESGRSTKKMSYENDEYNTEDYGMCPDCGEYLEDGVCADCGYGEDDDDVSDDDDDMGPEEEPFDYDSLEDEEDSMYGDDRKGYFDKDSDF